MDRLSKKIPVAILGATGTVGQKFIQLLEHHPWFEIVALGASERSVNRKYGECVNWQLDSPMSPKIAHMTIQACTPQLPAKIVFSGLDASVAGDIESDFANAGYSVISNSKNHRMSASVPLLIPEVNSEHLQLLKYQKFRNHGKIITNPNCSVIGLAIALKPLDTLSKIQSVDVVTMQAISGAGYPGVSSLDIVDNVIPHISGEEEKMQIEPNKILGDLIHQEVKFHPMEISAQCNRVPIIDGHFECVTVTLSDTVTPQQIIEAWNSFGVKNDLRLPSSPKEVICYHENPFYPQSRKHRNLGHGMTVSIGRLQSTTYRRWKFVLLSHNTVRGAAGGAILNAELLVSKSMSQPELLDI